jgi:hypothetical protein
MRWITRHKGIVSAGCGLLLSPSPVPGFFAAALFLPQGVHSDRGEWFVPVWIVSNFILFGSLVYWVLRSFATKQESRKQKGHDALGSGTLVEDRPVEGITYTETEVEEFRQRGLM